jgi:hypothetical protein
MKTSNFLRLDWNDLGKGLLVATGGAVLTAIQNTVSAGLLTFDWKAIGGVALAAGVSYLAKNLFTPAQLVNTVKK